MEAEDTSAGAVFSLEEIASHNNENDLWVIVLGRVYNLTRFIDKHPGGKQILIKCAGKDATESFLSRNHTRDAYEKLAEYFVGISKGSGKLKLFITYDETNPTNDSCIWRPHNQDLLTFRSSFLDAKFPTDANGFEAITSPQKDVYVFPMMKQAICTELFKSFMHYMNFDKLKASNGTKLDDFGMKEFADDLVQSSLLPIIRSKFEEYKAVTRFDDIYAKTVYYTENGDQDWPLHIDESIFTFNLCIGDSFEGNHLILLGAEGDRQPDGEEIEPIQYDHRVGQAILHYGKNRHSVGWLRKGTRCSVIILLNQPRFD